MSRRAGAVLPPARATIVLAALAIVAGYLVLRVRLLDVPLERDEGLFGVIGQAILRGEVPYRDVFEHKPPGSFYLFALALLLVPPTAAGLHAFVALWNLASLGCAAGLARALAGDAAGLWAALLFAMGSTAVSVEGFEASTEMLLLLPITASVWAAVAALDRRGSARTWRVVASGACAGAAFWIKQPAILAVAVAPLVLVLDEHTHRRRAALADVALWVTGGIALTVVAVGPLLLAAPWAEFWYWSFTHSWLYGRLPVGRWPLILAVRVRDLAPDLGVAVLAAIGGGWVALRAGHRRAWIALGFLASSVASALHSPFFYVHYFALVVPGVAVAGGVGLAAVCERIALRRGRSAARIAVVAGVGLVVAVPCLARPWYWLWPDPVAVSTGVLGRQGFDAAPMVARYLRERTAPEDRIFLYGSEPEIAFLAGRRDVNPFVMTYPITWPWPRHREFQERVWSAIERHPPAYLVVARAPFSRMDSRDTDPEFERRLSELVRRDYRLEAAVVYGVDGRPRFQPAPPDAAAEPGVVPLFELWRRVGKRS